MSRIAEKRNSSCDRSSASCSGVAINLASCGPHRPSRLQGQRAPKDRSDWEQAAGQEGSSVAPGNVSRYILWTHPIARSAAIMSVERFAGHSLHLCRKVAAPCSAAKFREEKPYAEKNCMALTYSCIPSSLQAAMLATRNFRVLTAHG